MERGVVVIRGSIEENASGPGGITDAWGGGSAELRQAVMALSCSESGVATAVGNFDG